MTSFPRSLILAVLACVAACSQASSSPSNSGDTTVALLECSWPTSLAPLGASGQPAQCVAARAYLSCGPTDGIVASCLSDDPTQCPGDRQTPCIDQCGADEYAAMCGGPGEAPRPAPPPGCRNLPNIPPPGIYCCPCGGFADAGADAG